MENVKFLILLLFIVVCDSSCPSTWYTIPGNRCIKVNKYEVDLPEIEDSTMCEKYTIGTKVASYISVTSPNDFAILYHFNMWVFNVYLDWNYVGSTYYYSNGSMVDIKEYPVTDATFRAGDCVYLDLWNQEVYGDCNLDKAGYLSRILSSGRLDLTKVVMESCDYCSPWTSPEFSVIGLGEVEVDCQVCRIVPVLSQDVAK
ncbi:uncharacterized protein LOC117119448 [Anneissia japonica]|uniref:uncharacterized protein LOC117119448 n=1 Tax=Anneissia japonica TaxID=1529436 RepID=UPI001425B183|nr:uncharacterized protein LOC117119448 [Anneissia japonica]